MGRLLVLDGAGTAIPDSATAEVAESMLPLGERTAHLDLPTLTLARRRCQEGGGCPLVEPALAERSTAPRVRFTTAAAVSARRWLWARL